MNVTEKPSRVCPGKMRSGPEKVIHSTNQGAGSGSAKEVPSQVAGHARKAGLYVQPGTLLGKVIGPIRGVPQDEERDDGAPSDQGEETGRVEMLVTLG